MTIDIETESAGELRQHLQIRAHVLHADGLEPEGGHDTAPGAHDYFDAALAACKTLTAHWYAKRNKIPLERAEAHVDRDASGERAGKYVLKVRVDFHGPLLTPEQRAKLHDVVTRCPIHKLMTTSEVVIETVAPAPPTV